MKQLNKSLKKIVVLLLALVLMLSVAGLTACVKKVDSSNHESSSSSSGPSIDPNPDTTDGVYFPIPKMNSERKLFVIGSEIADVSTSESRNTLLNPKLF